MSPSNKKSGGRDISDLKARLGLKKGGPASRKKTGGVVAPPGMKGKPSAVPVPPGAKPPAPEIPDAADDPFAAMSAMAAVGMAQQAAKGPEIIVVNDGAPVENVETKSKAIGILKAVGIVLVPLIVGIAIGQISKSAKAVNATISSAKTLSKDVNKVRVGIQDNILNPLLTALERGDGGNGFKLNDEQLTKDLEVVEKSVIIDPEKAFNAYMFDFPDQLRSDLLYYYAEAGALKKLVVEHVTKSTADAQAIKDGDKKLIESKLGEEENAYIYKRVFTQYGIFLDAPTEKAKEVEFGARLVELGPPVCQDRKASTTGKCPQTIGFGYRTTGTAEGWDLKQFGDPVGETVPIKRLIPLVKTDILAELIKGSKASVAAVAYMRRVVELHTKADELVKFGNSLEKQLKSKANQSESFTFFL